MVVELPQREEEGEGAEGGGSGALVGDVRRVGALSMIGGGKSISSAFR